MRRRSITLLYETKKKRSNQVYLMLPNTLAAGMCFKGSCMHGSQMTKCRLATTAWVACPPATTVLFMSFIPATASMTRNSSRKVCIHAPGLSSNHVISGRSSIKYLRPDSGCVAQDSQHNPCLRVQPDVFRHRYVGFSSHHRIRSHASPTRTPTVAEHPSFRDPALLQGHCRTPEQT